MAYTDGVYIARTRIRRLDQPYNPGDVVPGTAFSSEAEYDRYRRHGFIDIVETGTDSATFRVVGSGTSPEANASAARPSGDAPVYWMMANGVVPTNAVDGDIIWTADA